MPFGSQGLVSIFQELAAVVGLGDQWWGPGVVSLVVVGGLSPILVRNQKTSRARRLLTRALAAVEPAERRALEEEAFHEVESNPQGLLMLADFALERGRTDLARRAADRLGALGKLPYERRRIEIRLEGDRPRDPAQAAARISLALQLGLAAEAQERLTWARARWPDDADLVELEARVARDTPAG
jgi:hypothetical protein